MRTASAITTTRLVTRPTVTPPTKPSTALIAISPMRLSTTPELFRQAERTALRLRELDANVAAAQGHAQQSRAWPNPVAGVELEDVAGTGSYSGTSESQATLSLTSSPP